MVLVDGVSRLDFGLGLGTGSATIVCITGVMDITVFI